MAYLDNPRPLDGDEVGDGTDFYLLSLQGFLVAILPFHRVEEDVTTISDSPLTDSSIPILNFLGLLKEDFYF